MLVVRKPQDNLAKIVEALVLSFLIYGIVSAAIGVSAVTELGIINSRFVLWTAGVSLLLPVILSFLATNDFHMSVLRWLRVTGKQLMRQSGWTSSVASDGTSL